MRHWQSLLGKKEAAWSVKEFIFLRMTGPDWHTKMTLHTALKGPKVGGSGCPIRFLDPLLALPCRHQFESRSFDDEWRLDNWLEKKQDWNENIFCRWKQPKPEILAIGQIRKKFFFPFRSIPIKTKNLIDFGEIFLNSSHASIIKELARQKSSEWKSSRKPALLKSPN